MGDGGRRAGLSADLPVGSRDRPLGRRRVSRLLRGLRCLPDPGRAVARRPARVFQRDDGVRRTADGDHAGRRADPATDRRTRALTPDARGVNAPMSHGDIGRHAVPRQRDGNDAGPCHPAY
ncbi:hypothetical protein LUTEI9C_20020 [Luteimonas sp. 9C]|nr:hypothetical protein LUTEI9C_20020 [Luteimonas sp. 9C]